MTDTTGPKLTKKTRTFTTPGAPLDAIEEVTGHDFEAHGVTLFVHTMLSLPLSGGGMRRRWVVRYAETTTTTKAGTFLVLRADNITSRAEAVAVAVRKIKAQQEAEGAPAPRTAAEQAPRPHPARGTPMDAHTVPATEFTHALHAWNTSHPHANPPEASDTTPVPVTVAGTTVEVHPGLLRMLTALITDQQAAFAHPAGPCPHCAGTGQAAHATGPDPADFDSYEGSDRHIYHGFGEPDIEATAHAHDAHDAHDDDR